MEWGLPGGLREGMGTGEKKRKENSGIGKGEWAGMRKMCKKM